MKTRRAFQNIIPALILLLLSHGAWCQRVAPESFNFKSLSKNLLKQLPRISEGEEIDGGWKPLNKFIIPPGAKVFTQNDVQSQTPASPDIPSPLPATDFLAYVDPVKTIPPDPHGAVGLNHVVTCSNDSVIVHTKTGNIVSRMSFGTFMGNATVSDPYMQYDPYLDRYWVSGISTETTNKVYLAVSKSGDPSGDWWRYSFTPTSSDGALLLDHPYLGLDNKLVVVGGRKFPGASSFTGTILFAFDKTSLAAGTTLEFGVNAQTMEKTPTDGDAPCPVTAYGLTGVPAPNFYIIQNWNGSASAIRLSTITGDIPNLSWNTAAAVFSSGGSPWSDGSLGSLGQQLDEPRKIAVNDSRISSAVMLNGKIWCAHHLGLPANLPTHTAVQWWQISPLGEVLQRGRIDDPSGAVSRYYPTIAVNAAENVVLGYTVSSPTTRVNAAYSTRTAATPANSTDDEYVYKGGVSPYWKDFGSGRARWGDYSHSALDPVTGNLWTIQEYAEQRLGTSDNQSRYGLWWAEVGFNNFNNDAALSTIIEPNNGGPYCEVPLSISVSVTNIGKKTLNSISVGILVDGVPAATQTFTNLALPNFDTKILKLAATLSPSQGDHIFTAYTFNPNGVRDERTSNDTADIAFTLLPNLALPYSNGFESVVFPPANGWTLFNPDGADTWQPSNLAAKTGSFSLLYKAFDYSNVGQTDILRSPKIDLAATDSITLSFDVAYARHSTDEMDSLQVVYSTDCGVTWLPTAYRKQGTTLATSPSFFTAPFLPGPNDWRRDRVSLATCGINSPYLMLGLKAVNAYGNNIYLDNLKIDRVKGSINNVALAKISQPPVICSQAFTPAVNIVNNGSDTLRSLTISYQVDDAPASDFSFSGNVAKCASRDVTLNSVSATPGTHTLKIFTSAPNGKTDEDVTNDTLSVSFIVSPTITANIVEGFEANDFPPQNWGVVNEDNNITWERTTTAARSGNASMNLRSQDYDSHDTQDKFVSPVVDIDPAADSVFVSFDYANSPGLTFPGSSNLPLDTLEILLTNDCGQTFTSVWKRWGAGLQTINDANLQTAGSFVPKDSSQWKAIKLYLTPFTGVQNFQVYFVATSNRQNNLYIDNINIYQKILPARLKQQGYLIYPNPFVGRFILRHYQPPVNLQRMAVFNSVGQLVYTHAFNGTANTEVNIDLANLARGLYIVKLLYDDHTVVEKVIKD